MMGGLAHLVARATGQVKSGLTPRRAARFESILSDGVPLTEFNSETATASVIPPRVTPETTSSGPIPSPGPHSRTLESSGPKNTPHTPNAHIPRPAVNAPDLDDSTPAPGPLLSAVFPNEPAPPSTRIAHSHPEQTTDPATIHVETTEIHETFAPDRVDLSPRPEPLLAKRHGPAEVPALPIPARANTHPEARRSHPTATPVPDEIVIHIGRLDVIAQTEPANPEPKRKPRRAQMTELGDYLKGTGGGA